MFPSAPSHRHPTPTPRHTSTLEASELGLGDEGKDRRQRVPVACDDLWFLPTRCSRQVPDPQQMLIKPLFLALLLLVKA